VVRLYLGIMTSSRTVKRFAVGTCALGATALAFLAIMWIPNPYPANASCDTDHGYAAIKAHAEANSTLALLALSCAALGVAVCIAGALKAADHRVELPRTSTFLSASALFALGVLPFIGIGFVSFAALIGSGLYCQN